MISSRPVIEEVWENSFTLFQKSSVKDVIFKCQRLRRSLSVILIVGYFWTETAATREKEGRGFAVQNIFVANCKTSTDSFDLAGGRLFSTIAISFEIKKKVLHATGAQTLQTGTFSQQLLKVVIFHWKRRMNLFFEFGPAANIEWTWQFCTIWASSEPI